MGGRRSRSLISWSWVLLALLAAHDVTHVLDDGLDTRLGQLVYVALPQWLLLAIAMWAILRGDAPRNRIAALLMGVSVTIGFAIIHLLPLSPAAFWELRPSLISWLLVWVPAVTGLVLAALAWPPRRTTASGPAATSAPKTRGD